MKVTALTCVKNEGPFLLEWIAHGRVIGVTDFLFYSNDCDDGTDRLLDRLQEAGIVTHLPNPATKGKYQIEAFRDARSQACIRDADWIWVADVDEFLHIKVGTGKIAELITACGNPGVISIHHQHFANSGVDEFVDLPVIEQFQHSQNPDIWCDRFSIEVKTLMRTDFPLKYIGAHRPFQLDDTPRKNWPKWTDGSGRRVSPTFRTNGGDKRQLGFAAHGARDFATVNHYTLRSLDSYLVKSERGDVNRQGRSLTDAYWCDRNDSAFHDPAIQRDLPAVKKEIEALKKLPGIAAQHEECVALHRAKRDRLLKDPNFQALRDRLRKASPIPPAEFAAMERLRADFVAP